MSACPKCHRPFNEGNSPNAEECNGTDDDEGVCEAYAKVHTLRILLDDFNAAAEEELSGGGQSLNRLEILCARVKKLT